MRTRIWMAVLAAVLVAGTMTPAMALNREWAAALGFLGGVLVADSVNNHCRTDYREVVVERPVYVNREVVVERPVYIEPPVERVIVREPPPSGHYEYQTRQEWVPGQWVFEESYHGRLRQVWQPGYYQDVTVKIWVEDYAERPRHSRNRR
ncbi:MAG TPA: hypothetical protein DCZ95_15125 [Verrucomicrobia bacterium]|nr:MAG: hypothetical protein A2X46_15415 [Lentisphaerae bacterium GWF2_57_35]HBA85417.1 hypothetical protein [Verrucomicrobiota bacterium]